MNAKDLIPLLPAVVELVERMIASGHDPKAELDRIQDGYRARGRAEDDVQEAIRKKFGAL
jgi:hypothetical protein